MVPGSVFQAVLGNISVIETPPNESKFGKVLKFYEKLGSMELMQKFLIC